MVTRFDSVEYNKTNQYVGYSAGMVTVLLITYPGKLNYLPRLMSKFRQTDVYFRLPLM